MGIVPKLLIASTMKLQRYRCTTCPIGLSGLRMPVVVSQWTQATCVIAGSLRFTGVIGGAVLRLVRNLVVWRRSLDMPGWFSMRSIERQTFEQSNDWFSAFEETYGDRIG